MSHSTMDSQISRAEARAFFAEERRVSFLTLMIGVIAAANVASVVFTFAYA